MARRAESSQAIRSVSAAKHASDSGSIRSNLESDGVVIIVSIEAAERLSSGGAGGGTQPAPDKAS
jgi:hypothetical protein